MSSSGVALSSSSASRSALHRLDEEDVEAAQRILAEQQEQRGADDSVVIAARAAATRRASRRDGSRARFKPAAWRTPARVPSRRRRRTARRVDRTSAHQQRRVARHRSRARRSAATAGPARSRQPVADLEQLVELLAARRAPRSRRRAGRAARRRICAAAPTSTPQVGCETISSFGCGVDLAADDELLQVAARQALAPPRPGPPALTLKRWISRVGEARARRGSTAPPQRSCRSVRVSSVFWASDMVGTAPRPSALLGHEVQAPARAARARRARGRCRRSNRRSRRPWRAGSSPESAAISSCWPLPETPAMPTISPARTSKSMRRARCRTGRGWPATGRAPRDRRARARASRCCGCGGSAPIISRDRLGVGLLARIDLAGHPAAAQHRAWWHSARISSSLWLM